MTRSWRRRTANLVARALIYSTAVIALVPLGLVLIYTVVNGWPAVRHLDFFIHVERPVGIAGAGVAHALVGTAITVGMASIAAIPVGILAGIHLAEYRRHRWATIVRLACDVLVGTPSIVIGLFAYAIFVAPFHRFSSLAGSAALAILMLPVVARTTEGAVRLIPDGLREAGLALGVPRWRVILTLVLPAAAPGVVTGALLAVSRAAGEPAPLLFTSFGNRFFSLDPTHPMAALPLIVYHDALTPYPSLVTQAWGAALVLIAFALLVNLGSRLALRRSLRMAGSVQ